MDESVVNTLIEMGFQPNAAKRAVISSGNTGSDAATNWIMLHLDDADLNDPFEAAGGPSDGASFVPNDDAVATIAGMGFTSVQALKALKATDNNVERAIDWIFSHQDEMETLESEPVAPRKCSDGPGSKSRMAPHYLTIDAKRLTTGFSSQYRVRPFCFREPYGPIDNMRPLCCAYSERGPMGLVQ